jgi:CRISPR/Cas system CMR-associated protein Cmr5 small subunit
MLGSKEIEHTWQSILKERPSMILLDGVCESILPASSKEDELAELVIL